MTPSERPRLADVVTAGRHSAIVGTTASGKSAVALALARQDDSIEIVSADSMQVYRGMDIGTAKPTTAEQAEVRHHLIDLVDPDEEYAVARFALDVRNAFVDIERRGKRALLVGGTGLYVRAAVEDLEIPGQFDEVRVALEREPDTAVLFERLSVADPAAAARMEPGNRRRIVRALEVTLGTGRPFSSFGPGLTRYPDTPVNLLGVRRTRPDIDARLDARFRAQLAAGFLDEVQKLAARPAGISRTAGQALGYRELLDHVRGTAALQEAVDLATTRTRQFARRQERWFRRDPRIEWFDAAGTNDEGGPAVGRDVENLVARLRARVG